MGTCSSKTKSASLPGIDERPHERPSESNTKADVSANVRSYQNKQRAVSVAERLLKQTEGQRFHDNYVRPTLVSYGANCKVLTAYHKTTSAKVAVKTISKCPRAPEAQRANVLNEIGILVEVEDHPNAVKLCEVYDDANSYYLVMDCCDGGELFEHISKAKEAFTERHAAQILRSLMLFLAHMHSKGIAHMDIKPENIMFDSEGAQGVVKVIDFGSSVFIQPEETVHDAFGTVRYSSPEMAADIGIGQKTDVWSAGIVMYFMLCGSAPFLKKHEVDTLNYIKNKPRVKFSGTRWASVSQQAKDCISAMLEVEPSRRPSVQEVLAMPWLRSQAPDVSIRNDIMSHLRSFANQSRMRRLLLGLMAANLSGPEANRLLNHFYSMDSDFSGTIELQELAKVAKKALPDLADSEVERLFHALDLNHTGTVDIKEFFASLLHTMAPENQVAVARKSFINLDREHSGYVTKEVFVDAMVQQAVANGMSDEDKALLLNELEAEFMALDANSDGRLSFDEFKSVLGLEDSGNAEGEAAMKSLLMAKQIGGGSRGGTPPTSSGGLRVRRENPNSMSTGGSCPLRVSSSQTQAQRELAEAAGACPAATMSMPNNTQSTDIVRLALVLQETTLNTRRASVSDMHPASENGSVSFIEPVSRDASSQDLVGSVEGVSSTLQGTSPLGHVSPYTAQLSQGNTGGARSVSFGKNPAAAAAAMAAAVAATVAATSCTSGPLPSDFDRDSRWPVDPAMASARLGRPAVRVSHDAGRQGPGGHQDEGESGDQRSVTWHLEQGWFGSSTPKGHPRKSSAGSYQQPMLQDSAGGGLAHACGLPASRSSNSIACKPGSWFERRSRETGEAEAPVLLQYSSSVQAAAIPSKVGSFARSGSGTGVDEAANVGLASVPPGHPGCLDSLVSTVSGRTLSGRGGLLSG